MKNYLIISLLILSVGFCQKEYNSNDLIKMDNGLYTVKFSDKPITGKVYGYFGEGKPLTKVYIGELVNGKKEGIWTWWYSTGTKIDEMTYKDGEPNGLYTYWNLNGQKKSQLVHYQEIGIFWLVNRNFQKKLMHYTILLVDLILKNIQNVKVPSFGLSIKVKFLPNI